MPVVCGLLVLVFESADHLIDAWLHRAQEIAAAYGGTVTARGSRRHRKRHKRKTMLRQAGAHRFCACLTSVTLLPAALSSPRSSPSHLHLGRIRRTARQRFTEVARTVLERACGATGRLTHVYPDSPAPYLWDLRRRELGLSGYSMGRDQKLLCSRRLSPVVRPAAPGPLRGSSACGEVRAGPGRERQPRDTGRPVISRARSAAARRGSAA